MTDPADQLPVTFDVSGRPAPKGSQNTYGFGKVVESSRHLPAWTAAVTLAAKRAWKFGEIDKHVPLGLFVTFRTKRPQAPKHPVHDVTVPDLDKLVRAVGDALAGVIYHDDAQVSLLRAEKLLTDHNDIAEAGCTITVARA